MVTSLPFLTSYDPSATSEGTLDPLGLYQIADQLAVQLVPAVRERMQRVRFLTAMAVGALVTEDLEDNPEVRDASPYLVWEWLVVEALMRTKGEDPGVWGIPGTLVARRALNQHGYLDARSYLKTPRIFGFHGVYKRLATHLRLVDVHLRPGPNAESLTDVWARSIGLRNFNEAKPLLSTWATELKRCMREKPPRTRPNWTSKNWNELAEAFAPSNCRLQERRYLVNLLLDQHERRLGALPALWQLLSETKEELTEEALHDLLARCEPANATLLHAIRSYEAFARALHDAFDLLRAGATSLDARGFEITSIASDPDFKLSVNNLHRRFATAHRALSEVNANDLFARRFAAFAQPQDTGACALALCIHHEEIQRAKAATGKRPWFDRIDRQRIYIRHAYREKKREIQPDRYVHDYRSKPIRNFYNDLT